MKETKPIETIAAEYKHELELIYQWRLQFVRDRLGGRLSLEYMTLDYLGNFDELHMPLTPKAMSEKWFKAAYTLGYFSFASGHRIVAPMFAVAGVLQGKVKNPIMVSLEGTEYPIFYYENDTHKQNEYLYENYIKHAVHPELISEDIYLDYLQECVLKQYTVPPDLGERVTGCLVDDGYRSHWTPRVEKVLRIFDVTIFSVTILK
jgi:hypothetical protein